MNTKKLLVLIAFLFIVLVIPGTVVATTELYQEDFNNAKETPNTATEKGIIFKDDLENSSDYNMPAGEYKLMEDIDLGNGSISIYNGDYTFDLNEHTLSSSEENDVLYYYQGTLTITGNGKIENKSGYRAIGCMYSDDESDPTILNIENGTFIGEICLKHSIATINNGTFEGQGNYYALYAIDGSTVTINDGDFSASNIAVCFEPGESTERQGRNGIPENPAKIIINDGSFIASKCGVMIKSAEDVSLKGGFYITDGDSTVGGIVANVDGEEGFLGFLAETYRYNEPLEISDASALGEGLLATQPIIVVTDHVKELYQLDFYKAKETPFENQPTYNGVYYKDGVFSLEPGDYRLSGDIELEDGDRIELSGGDFELDLNGCWITGCLDDNPVLSFHDGSLLIKGEKGIFNYSMDSEDILEFGANSNVTLEDSIFQGNVTIEDGANCTIKSGRFCGYMYVNDSVLTVEDFELEETLVINHSNVTINNGKIICEDNDAIYVENASNLTINDGEFQSDAYFAVLAEAGFWEDEIDNEKITINGGKFTGVLSALAIYETDEVILKGGTYSIAGDSEGSMGAIVTEADGEEEFLNFLGEGFGYSEPLVLSSIPGDNYEGQLATQNSISIVYGGYTGKENNNEEAESQPITYEVVKGANQECKLGDENGTTFTINADYSLFENGGKVFVDGKETKEFTSKSGSTVITLNKDFVNSLSVGEHTLKVAFNNGGEATTKFTITKTEEDTSSNPTTGDNIMLWISLMIVSILGIIGTVKFTNKRK